MSREYNCQITSVDEVFYHVKKIFTLLFIFLRTCAFFHHLCIISFFSKNCIASYSKSLWSIIKSEREYLRRMRHARPRKAATTIQITTMRITIKLDKAATPKKSTIKCPYPVSIIKRTAVFCISTLLY